MEKIVHSHHIFRNNFNGELPEARHGGILSPPEGCGLDPSIHMTSLPFLLDTVRLLGIAEGQGGGEGNKTSRIQEGGLVGQGEEEGGMNFSGRLSDWV